MGHKICPSCGFKNPEEEIVCKKCMTDLTGVEIVQDDNVPEEKTVATTNYITLVGEGFSIVVRDGDVVGRQGMGAENLKNFKTVSRKHARFSKDGGRWFIEDLNSTNGTFVNDQLVPPNQKREINDGDTIKLSSQVALRVKL